MSPKQRAAEAAIGFLQHNMVLGLGTGSTADHFLQALASHLKNGKLSNIIGIPTSHQSEKRARELGIPLTTLAQHPQPDLTVDGADEIDPQLNLIKGLGGALLREKIVAQNSLKLLIIADSGKCVTHLGTQSPLPVEVTPFGHESHVLFFQKLGAVSTLRKCSDGSTFVTDNGNYIYDCQFSQIADPVALEAALASRAGIVTCGLFLKMAEIALVGDNESVKEVKRPIC
jgi:ribose 5-phosphate isomerase A